MANWVEPKSNYVATDQVTPNIFNTLAENEKFLYEIRCPMEVQESDGSVTKINSLVFVETTTSGVYKAKYKKSDGTLVEIPIEASQSVKLKSSRSIGIQGLDAESASFNGTSAVKIKVTGVPAELLYGTAEIDITGNATKAEKATMADKATLADRATYAESAGTVTSAGYAVSAGTAEEAEHAATADLASKATSATTATSATNATKAGMFNGSFTEFTPGTTNLSFGTYMIRTIINDESSQIGGHGTSFTDIITVDEKLQDEYSYRFSEYFCGPIHIYSGNSYESPWFRTARIKYYSYSYSSKQFKVNLYVSSSGGYATSNTDVNGTQLYPNTLASSISNLKYKMYYKRIL